MGVSMKLKATLPIAAGAVSCISTPKTNQPPKPLQNISSWVLTKHLGYVIMALPQTSRLPERSFSL